MGDWENSPHRNATFIERLLGSKFGTLLTSATVLFCIAIAILMQTQDKAEVAGGAPRGEFTPPPRAHRLAEPRRAPSPLPVASETAAPAVKAEPVASPSPTPSVIAEPDPEKVIRKMEKSSNRHAAASSSKKRRPARRSDSISKRLKNDREVLYTHGKGDEKHAHNAAGYRIGDPDEHKHKPNTKAVAALLRKFCLKNLDLKQLDDILRKLKGGEPPSNRSK